ASGGNAVQLAIDNNNKLITGCDIAENNNYNMLLSRFFLEDAPDILMADVKKTSIEKQENNFEIFPNPAADKISIKGLTGTDNIHFIINDNTGNMMLQGVLNKSMQVNVSNLSAGIYYLHIAYTGNDKTIKFIKQ
ncbi:MAG: T9SS type A sorting domain-containing protein, partial [Parafilimonas sp.]